jgi:hypothetical protein
VEEMTDWSKAFEVFGSGIIGVFMVMVLLMLLTQGSTKVIDLVEKWMKSKEDEKVAEPKPQAVAVKE